MDRTELLEKCLDACIKEEKLLKQSVLADNIKVPITKLRAVLGTAGTTKKIMRSYLSFDKDGNLLSTELKKDINEFTDKHINDQLISVANENRKLKKKLDSLRKDKSLEDKVLDIVQDEVRALPSPPVINSLKIPDKPKGEDKALLLLLSDIHAGEVVSIEEMGGLNEYNLLIMAKRFQFLVNHVIHKIKRYKNVNTIYIALLGDMVSGDIHDELMATNETNVIECAFILTSVLNQVIIELAKHMKNVVVLGVVGNHGRLTRKKYYKNKYVNWDYVIYKAIQSAMVNQKNVRCVFPKSFFHIENILGHDFLFLHGDDIRAWQGIPWYGINRATDKLDDALKYNGKTFESLFLAHFHNTGQLDKSLGEVIINSSMIGGNEFSLGRMFAISRPKQLLMCVEEDMGLTWREPIALHTAASVIADDELRYGQVVR